MTKRWEPSNPKASDSKEYDLPPTKKWARAHSFIRPDSSREWIIAPERERCKERMTGRFGDRPRVPAEKSGPLRSTERPESLLLPPNYYCCWPGFFFGVAGGVFGLAGAGAFFTG